MAPAPQVPSLRIRSLSRRSTGPPIPTQTTIEHKHGFFYTSMDLSVSSSDAPSENGPSMLDSTFSQTAPGASACIHILFRDSSTLLTCAFHQTRCTLCLRAWFQPRFDLHCSSKGQDVDLTPSASLLALCPTMTDAHRHPWGDRPHAEPERVEPIVQGHADAPEPVCRAARLMRRKDRHATREPQVLRCVLNHPHCHVSARAGA